MYYQEASPFFKSVGSKTKLVPTIRELLPGPVETYYEPFVGTGAMLFEMARCNYFKTARIYDINPFVMSAFAEVKHSPLFLRQALFQWSPFDREQFEQAKVALTLPENPFGYKPTIEQTAAFLFVSLCCFSGNLRWNRNGLCTSQWNKPQSRRSRMVDALEGGRLGLRHLTKINMVLQDVILDGYDNDVNPGKEFLHFSEMIGDSQPGDFVFCDPPYIKNAGLYLGAGFGPQYARVLSFKCSQASQKGVHVAIAESQSEQCDMLFRWAKKIETERDNLAARRFFGNGAQPTMKESFYVSPGLKQKVN